MLESRVAIPAIPAMNGELAYPRKNGEPTFAAPWQSRAFGMVVDLHVRGVFPWDEFKHRLIAEVARRSAHNGTANESGYYDQWVDAFFRLLLEKGILTPQEIDRRVEDFRIGVRQDVY